VFRRPIVVENRPGAIGTIGLNVVARATADGYTFGVLAMPYVVAPSLLAHVPYDTEKDLTPVILVNWNYSILAVPSISPVRSVAGLVTMAKARPGLLKFSSNGNGTPPHLAGELFKREAGVSIRHIPYKGSVAGLSALLADEVDVTFGTAALVIPFVRSGKLRALATAAPRRLAETPDIPTLVELGYPRLEISDWQGIVAPAATPKALIRRMHSEITRILATPEFRQRLVSLGMEPAGGGPEEFSAHVHNEIRRWSKLVREAGIAAD
jgi:tripartite-type tricarboxylate transporter receptor subunit TctC